MTREQEFRQIAEEMASLYERKHADYGSNFEDLFARFGMLSSVIRFYDKIQRIENMTKTGKQNVSDESIEDTLKDLANYSIMTMIEIRRNKREKNMCTSNE
jgi:hypothetical protein